MNSLLNHFNSPWAETLGWCLLHSIWQITAIAMLFWIALQLLRNASPDTRYWTGCATLILMAATPILTVNMLTTAPADPASYSNAPANVTAMGGPTMIDTATFSNSSDEIAVSIVNPQSTNTGTANQVGVYQRAGIVEWIQPALPVLAGCWLAGVWVGLLRTTMGFWAAQRMRKSGGSAVSDSIRNSAAKLADKMGIRRKVEIVQSVIVTVPATIGHWKPLILLPGSVITGLTTLQLESVIAHELAHIRRHDFWVNALQSVVEALLFYHPLAWWVSRAIRQERENCCDDEAVAACGRLTDYAEAMLVVEQLQGSAPVAALAANGGSVLQRIRRLAGRPNPARFSSGWFLSALMMIVASVSVFLLIMPDRASAVISDDETKQVEEFMFDKLTVQTTSFDLSGNHTLVIDKKGAYEFWANRDPDQVSRHQLNQAEMTKLAELVSNTDNLNVPDDQQRMKTADATRYKLILERDTKTLSVECDENELTAVLKPLIHFLEQIHEQEGVFHGIAADANDPAHVLLWLNLKLDSALGRRKPPSPPTLALNYSRLLPRLRTLVKGDDERVSDRAERAIRMIKQLAGDDPDARSTDQRLASFSNFSASVKSRSPDTFTISVSPDGWLEVWAFATIGSEEEPSLTHQHVGKLSGEQLKELDQLVSATHHFRDKNMVEDPRAMEWYELSAIHESMWRDAICRGATDSEEYAKLVEFVRPLFRKERKKLPKISWQPFSQQRFDAAVARQQPVLVHFHASWVSKIYLQSECALDSSGLALEIQDKGIVCLEGDVTGTEPGDPKPTDFEDFRNSIFRGPGIALYLPKLNKKIECDDLATSNVLPAIRRAFKNQ